jgi:signal transduction histidine kinase
MRCLRVFVLVLFISTPGLTVGAQQPDESLIVRIGYTILPPFSGQSKRGTAQGYSIDLLRMFLEPRGYALSFVEFSNPALMLEALEAGTIDATSLLAINDARRQIGRFTTAIDTFSTSVFVRRATQAPTRLQDLQGARIGVSRGALAQYLVEVIPGAEVMAFEHIQDVFMPLLSGDIDAVAAPTRAMQHQLRATSLGDKIVLAPLRLKETRAGVLVHPDRLRLLRDLDIAIEQARAGGRIARLQTKWFFPPRRTFSQEELKAFGLALCIVALLGLAWLRAFLRVVRQARHLNDRTRQLQSALDAVGATFLLADREGRVVWWNKAYLVRNHGFDNALETGTTLEDHLTNLALSAPVAVRLGAEEARQLARRRIERLKSDRQTGWMSTTEDGRVLKHRLFRLAGGEFVAIATDISEMAAERDTIRLDAARLEATNARLERFSQMVAHDLVAPIRNQRALLDFIREDLAQSDAVMPDDLQDHFHQSELLLERQSQLVTDLLDWSKTVQHEEAQPFDTLDRVRNAVTLAAVPAGFTVSLPEAIPEVVASPIAFELVLRNLVANAVKHHDRSIGEIYIGYREEDEKLAFLVSDDGPGVPADCLQQIFEPFETLKSKDAGGGSGLGLSFVREVVTAWGGEVEALESRAARGACFRFTVPKRKAPPHADTWPHLRVVNGS